MILELPIRMGNFPNIMPEGPEVAIISDYLHQHYEGKILLDVRWDKKSKFRDGLPGYSKSTFPQRVESVKSHGKKIFFFLAPMSDAKKNRTTIICGLGMEGRFLHHATKHTNLHFLFDQESSEGDQVSNEGEILYFEDTRHFGNILITESWEKEFKKLGPDPLHHNIPMDDWIAQFRRHPRLQIGNALLDQAIIAGVGNYLRADILYHAKIGPRDRIGSLSDDHLRRLHHSTTYLIRISYHAGGCTLRTYLSPDGKRGLYKPLVYGRKTTDDGEPVKYEKFGNRGLYWVPS
jgi:DNA-formamidopyrimidine glycosylase